MHRILFLLIASACSACLQAQDASPTQVILSSPVSDVGDVYPFADVNAIAELKNLGQDSIEIGRIASRSPIEPANIDFDVASVDPGESIDVVITFKAPERVGGMSRRFDVYAKKSEEKLAVITVKGFVDWLVDPASLMADLGIWQIDKPIRKNIALKNRPGTDVRMTKVLTDSKNFDLSLADDGKSLNLVSRKSMTWGIVEESVSVQTSNPLQQKIVFHIRGEARGPVVPSTGLASFDPVREGESPEQIVRLTNESDGKINIGEVEVRGTEISATIKECAPKLDNCKLLVLKLPPQKLGSPPRGVVKIELPDYKAILPIYYGGTVIGKNTQIRNLADDLESAKELPVSISSALRESTNKLIPLEMPVPAGTSPLITWQVTNEKSVYGYEVYRGDSEAAEFVRLNDRLLRRLDSADGQMSIYRWRDATAESGREYWYYINIVYVSGEKKNLTNPQKVLAK